MARSKKMLKVRQANRGPAAAAANRAALLASAKRVFGARGYLAPLSAIARDACVGQAVLYRHFPTRLALAQAVFEENLRAYEEMTEMPGPRTLHLLWESICDHLVECAAFVEMSVEARRTSPALDEQDRLRAMVEAALGPALAAETVPPDFTVREFLLGIRMAYGLVVTSMTGEEALRQTLKVALPRLTSPRRGGAASSR